jgi:hypothetical protein
MRFIEVDKHNDKILTVAWMWLPCFIGQNTALLGELDHVLSAKFPPPFEPTEEKLDEIHRFVIDWLCDKHKIPGLWHYLRAVEEVNIEKTIRREHEMGVEEP